METNNPSTPPARKPNYVGTGIAVIVAFLAGIFVGLHPAWIPIHTNGGANFNTPIETPGAATDTDRDVHTMPSTEATTEPTTQG